MSSFEIVLNFSYEFAYCSIAIEAGSRNSRNKQFYSARGWLEDLSLH